MTINTGMENLGIIIAIVGTGITFVAAMVALFLWLRTESNSDRRHMDAKLESNRELVRAIYDEGKNYREGVALEMKDFHYKLLEIERNRK